MKRMHGPLSALLLACLPVFHALPAKSATLPQGCEILSGQGEITIQDDTWRVQQSSLQLELSCGSFVLDRGTSVEIEQPSADAQLDIRVSGIEGARIDGDIYASGSLSLTAPHGVELARDARIAAANVAIDASGDGAAAVRNQGHIGVDAGGMVQLSGHEVSNDGTILAPRGVVNIRAALPGRLQTGLSDNDIAVNRGVIGVHAASGTGGDVRLVAMGGNAVQDGNIRANGTHGGTVHVLSDRNVAITGRIDASGQQGGGTIRVGGGWQGGEGLQAAQAVYVGPDAILEADAMRDGNGGSVVVWGDQINNFFGSIFARGGAAGGDGGRVETSAYVALNAQGSVNASAPAGKAGSWLLDPYNVTLVNGSSGALSGTSSNRYFSASANDSQIGISVIENALSGGSNVSIFTGSGGTQNGDITVAGSIDAPGRASLYLKAAGSIYVDESISGRSGSGPLDLHLWANYGGEAEDLSYTGRTDCLICGVFVGRSNGFIDIDISRGVLDIRTGDNTYTGGKVQFGNGTTGSMGSVHAGEFSIRAHNIDMGWGNYQFNVQDTTLDAGQGNIALTGNELSFGGDLSVTGDLITLDGGTPATTIKADSQSYQGQVVLDNDVILDSSSGNGAVHVTGKVDNATATARALMVNAGSGAITFGGAVGSGANEALAGLTVTGGSFDAASMAIGVGGLSVMTSDGGINQSGAFKVTGASTFDAGTHTIKLDNAGNDFADTVQLTGGAASINDSNDLNLGALYVGSLTADSLGTLDLGSGSIAGNLAASSHGAIIQSGALGVGGATTLDAGAANITLTDSANLFIGVVNLSGGVATVHSTTTLQLGAVNVGTLDAWATSILLPGYITTAGNQSYNGAVTASGDVALDAGGSVQFASTVATPAALSITADGDVNVSGNVIAGDLTVDAGSLALDAMLDVTGNLSLETQVGDILQGGAFTVGGESSFTTGAGYYVVLGSPGNDFGGAVSLDTDLATIFDANALTLGDVAVDTLMLSSNGALNLGTGTITGSLSAFSNGGAISQSGALIVLGTSTIDAGSGTITLLHAGNDFGGTLSLAGGDAQINDANALSLGTLSASGSFTATSVGALDLGAGSIVGDLIASSRGGAIGQTGALMVTGTSTLDAGSGEITLDNAGNQFAGNVSAIAGQATLTNTSSLGIDDVALATGVAITAPDAVVGTGHALAFGNGGSTGSISGNYTQQGTLHLHATLDGSDVLAVQGAAQLGGSLDVDFSASPTTEQEFTVLTASSVSGTFDALNVTGLSTDWVATADYQADKVTIRVTPPTHRVGGQVSGLSGSGLVLQINDGETLSITGNGPFEFPTLLEEGETYDVTVSSEPTDPTQTCTVTNGQGTIDTSDVTDIQVDCVDVPPQLTLTIDASHPYVRYGQIVDYIVMLSNDGVDTARDIPVEFTLSPALDVDHMQWQCFGGSAGAACTAIADGQLADLATLPPGRTLIWLVKVPVRIDTDEPEANFGVMVDGADPETTSESSVVVIMRDGFDVPYGDGTQVVDGKAEAILAGEDSEALLVPPAVGESFESLLLVRGRSEDVSVQWLSLRTGTSIVRLLSRDASGLERSAAWVEVVDGTRLMLGGMRTDDGSRLLLLEGGETSSVLPLDDPEEPSDEPDGGDAVRMNR